MKKFEIIGENLHCSRLVLLKGKSVQQLADGSLSFRYHASNRQVKSFPVYPDFLERSPAAKSGKLKMVALALDSAMRQRPGGAEYLLEIAQLQLEHGADYLDLNVDEFAVSEEEQCQAMAFLTGFFSEQMPHVPLCFDSSNFNVINTGLALLKSQPRAMINSINFKNIESIHYLAPERLRLIVSASGEALMPASVDERVDNLKKLIKRLEAKGFQREMLHLDPLIYPISVEPQSAVDFLATAQELGKLFPECKISGGFSNLSFGLPNRKLLNSYFLRLALEKGRCSSGIIDPVTIQVAEAMDLDLETSEAKVVLDLLYGNDDFAMNYMEYCQSK